MLPRTWTSRIAFILDELLPPVVRDSRWLMAPLLRLVGGANAGLIQRFKERAPAMSADEMRETYAALAPLSAERETDLTAASAQAVIDAVRGDTVLEVGCGRGWLAARLPAPSVTAVDFVIAADARRAAPAARFLCADIERLPFRDRAFDTVVSTHTLEHVRDPRAALAELRRVARGRVVIAVPCQRPYRYTFDLHLHFFPYPHSLLALTGPAGTCRKVGPDLVYVEDR